MVCFYECISKTCLKLLSLKTFLFVPNLIIQQLTQQLTDFHGEIQTHAKPTSAKFTQVRFQLGSLFSCGGFQFPSASLSGLLLQRVMFCKLD